MAHHNQPQFTPFEEAASPPTARAEHPSSAKAWPKWIHSGSQDCCVTVAAQRLESEAALGPNLMDEQPKPSIIKALTVLHTVKVVATVVYLLLCMVLVASVAKLRPFRSWAIFTSVNICLAAASLCLNVVWLTLTALPRTRARAFGGRACCTKFTSDMASDITFAVLWSAMVILDSMSLAVRSYRDPRMQVALFLSVILLCMHIVTAVLSVLVRKQLRKATIGAAAGRLGGALNEVSLQKMEAGAGAGSGPGARAFGDAANCRAML